MRMMRTEDYWFWAHEVGDRAANAALMEDVSRYSASSLARLFKHQVKMAELRNRTVVVGDG